MEKEDMEKLSKKKKIMRLASDSSDDGVEDPTNPSQEIIKHDTTADSDVAAADVTINSDDDQDVKRSGKKKRFSLDSSSEDDGVLDPTHASPFPIRHEPTEGTVTKKKMASLDSSDEEDTSKRRKTTALDSDSDDDLALARGPFESTTVLRLGKDEETVEYASKPVVEGDKEVDKASSRSRSRSRMSSVNGSRKSRSSSRRSRSSSLSSLDSRMSSRAPSSRPSSRLDDTLDSRLDDTLDSRLEDSRLDDSRLDDSRLEDSRLVPSSPSTPSQGRKQLSSQGGKE